MPKVLIVDDERDVVALIKFLLEKDGLEVEEAYNGVEALKKLGVEPKASPAFKPDLVVLDVMMPVMDGLEVAARLKDHAPLQSVPLLVLSAKGELGEGKPPHPNITAILEKPFDPRKLRELVGNLLKTRK